MPAGPRQDYARAACAAALPVGSFLRDAVASYKEQLASVLCAMPDIQDFDYAFRHAIDRYVRQGRKDQLARAGLFPFASAMRGVDAALSAVINGLGHVAGRGGIIAPDVPRDAVQVLGCGRRPSQTH